MLRPKSDSTRAIAASNCHGTPQPESRAARSIVARWSAVSVGTYARQSSAGSASGVSVSVGVGWAALVGLDCGVGVVAWVGLATGLGLTLATAAAFGTGLTAGLAAGLW